MIEVYTRDNVYPINPTLFPDKTSQIWKTGIERASQYLIHWNYSDESEIIQLAQLVDLLRAVSDNPRITLFMPYCPYGRQDKPIDDSTTFARKTFESLLSYMDFESVLAVDTHSKSLIVETIYPVDDWKQKLDPNQCVLIKEPYDLIVFPDKGAQNKYAPIMKNVGINIDTTYFEKRRDQLTGEIQGIYPVEPDKVEVSKNIMVIDDICDGGRTFIELIKFMPNKTVDLFVSHGLYTKGRQVLYDAGYRYLLTATHNQYLTKIWRNMFELESLKGKL